MQEEKPDSTLEPIFFANLYQTAIEDIALKLDRSVKSVVSKAHNLGLKKDPDRLREMGRENVSLRYKG